MLASSHVSIPTRRESPHTGAQLSLVVGEPPVHVKPVSIWHVDEQPSPASVLLSSHCSRLLHRIFLPSPQMGAHESRPPTPLPSVLDEVHAKPSSIWHSAEQPSPAAVLLSSHASAVERMPLPQTCTGGVYESASVVDSLPVTKSSSTTSPVDSSRSASTGEVPDEVTEAPAVRAALSRRRDDGASARESSDVLTSIDGCGPRCAGSPSE